LSVTVQVIRVVPIGKLVGALFVTDATPQLSPTEGLPNVTLVIVHEAEALALISAGATIVGFV
jgi:hypothetical protein